MNFITSSSFGQLKTTTKRYFMVLSIKMAENDSGKTRIALSGDLELWGQMSEEEKLEVSRQIAAITAKGKREIVTTEVLNVNDNTRYPINGRELHTRLGIGTAYKDWFPRMCEYGFVAGMDFNPLKTERVQIEGKRQVKREVIDHMLSLSMAKEICMLQRTEQGRQIRRYLIEIEERWNSPEAVMERALQIAHERVEALNKQVLHLEKRVASDAPKLLFAQSVESSQSDLLIGDLAKILRQNGVNVGRNRLFEWLRRDGFLASSRGSDYNTPTQKSIDMGLMRISETAIIHASGVVTVTKTPRITGKGQVYFVNRYVNS